MLFFLATDLVNVQKSVLVKLFLQNFSSDLVNVFGVLLGLNKTWHNPTQMIATFRNFGISLNIDGSEDEEMKFQGHERGLPSDIIIG